MKKLARRHRGLGNPTSSSDVSTALSWLAGGALVGAGLGAVSSTPRTTGALTGAYSGVALVGVGGLGAAVVSPKNRGAGFATAAIGLGGLATLAVVSNVFGLKLA